MSTHNLYFEQKYEKYKHFSSENFRFLVVRFSIYLNGIVFFMYPLYPQSACRYMSEDTFFSLCDLIYSEILTIYHA